MRGLIDAEPAPPADSRTINWDALDYRYSNDVLARQLGTSSTTVAKKRKQLNKPKSSIFNRHK